MHPFFNSARRVLTLITGWLLLTTILCGLVSTAAGTDLFQSLLAFGPAYSLCLGLAIPAYYVCRGLPLEQTSPGMLMGSHLLTLIVVLSMWALAGYGYTLLIESITGNGRLYALFGAQLYMNLAIVAILFEIMVLIHYLFFATERSRDLERQALQQKLLISQAELQTLKATVHPHFLFNSLNTLANLALSDSEQAHRFCLLLAGFLRYSVAYSKKNAVSLSEEIEHIQNYLGIERERFGGRLKSTFSIDESLGECIVPPLILFPVVENAIKHGIDSCIEGGTLSLVIRQGDGMVIIEVSNPVDELGRKLKGTGHGIASVERRLRNRFDENARFKTSREDGRFVARIYLPIERASEHATNHITQRYDSEVRLS